LGDRIPEKTKMHQLSIIYANATIDLSRRDADSSTKNMKFCIFCDYTLKAGIGKPIATHGLLKKGDLILVILRYLLIKFLTALISGVALPVLFTLFGFVRNPSYGYADIAYIPYFLLVVTMYSIPLFLSLGNLSSVLIDLLTYKLKSKKTLVYTIRIILYACAGWVIAYIWGIGYSNELGMHILCLFGMVLFYHVSLFLEWYATKIANQ
jgi:hypothetical protein